MLTDLLKERTKTNHQLLEKKLINEIRHIRSDQDYMKILGAFYSYFGALEAMIDKSLDISVLPDIAGRRKSSSLAADIQAFNAVLPPLAEDTSIPEIRNTSQALGALYVIEGSTLGGLIISQMITKKLGSAKGLSFFEAYGEATMQKWDVFKKALNSAPGLSEAELIAAADQTFGKFSAWLDRAF